MSSQYIYGVVNANQSLVFDVTGLAGGFAQACRYLMTYAKAQTQAQNQNQNLDSHEWLFDASTAADMVMINVVRQSMNTPEATGTTQENAA